MPEIESVYKAARIAYCPNAPDSNDRQATAFLQECIDAGSNLYKAAAREQFSEEGVEDLIPEYAESCIPIYRWNLWNTWVQLGGYESTENELYPVDRLGGDTSGFDLDRDLDRIAQADCYMWAELIIRYRAASS